MINYKTDSSDLAIAQKNMGALGGALVAITIMIVLVDQFFWRPLIVWSDKFRLEQSASVNVVESWVYDIITTARIPTLVSESLTPFTDRINEILSALSKISKKTKKTVSSNNETIYNVSLWLILGVLMALILHFILSTVGVTTCKQEHLDPQTRQILDHIICK